MRRVSRAMKILAKINFFSCFSGVLEAAVERVQYFGEEDRSRWFGAHIYYDHSLRGSGARFDISFNQSHPTKCQQRVVWHVPQSIQIRFEHVRRRWM